MNNTNTTTPVNPIISFSDALFEEDGFLFKDGFRVESVITHAYIRQAASGSWCIDIFNPWTQSEETYGACTIAEALNIFEDWTPLEEDDEDILI